MDPISPRHLRAVTGTKSSDVARALGLSPASLRLLEATPAAGWTVAQLSAYVAACRQRLEITTVDRLDGERRAIDPA